jgi:hypothetical protein
MSGVGGVFDAIPSPTLSLGVLDMGMMRLGRLVLQSVSLGR